ncbi:15030_t:CDS:2, partial [Funneliformis geosporum]
MNFKQQRKIQKLERKGFTNIKYLAEGGFSKIYTVPARRKKKVVLKVLNNSQNITLKFLQEIANHNLAINTKFIRLNYIHQRGLVHGDLHSGNILNENSISYITDLGLSRSIDSQVETEKIYGVLPYIAPEVLRGQPYTQASDVYSFGIIAYELFANTYPYYEFKDLDENELILKICRGLRPNMDE